MAWGRRHPEVTDDELKGHPYAALIPIRLLGATSLEEQVFCQWYAEHALRGRGAVAELNVWLGSLTVPTLRGLQKNPAVPRDRRVVHGYDEFLWTDGYEQWAAGTEYAGRYQPGDSFLMLYREIVAPYREDVTVVPHQEHLSAARWTGGPIELLINDIWKDLAIMANVVEQFFPSLLPDAILFHQDYLWASESFVHVAMFQLRDYFRFVCRIKNSTTALFRKTGEIPESVLEQVTSRRSWADFTEEEVREAFAWSRSLFEEEEARLVVDAGEAWLLLQMGHEDAARRIFAKVKQSSGYGHHFYQFQEMVLTNWGLGHVIGPRE
jgi:hypothetical protein